MVQVSLLSFILLQAATQSLMKAPLAQTQQAFPAFTHRKFTLKKYF